MPRGDVEDLQAPTTWSSLGNIGRGVLDAMFGGPDPARRRPSHGGKEIVADEAIRRYREGVTPSPYPVELYDYDPVKPFESLPTHDEEGDKQRREQVDVAMPIALSAAGTRIPFAKRGELGIFGGKLAAGADLAKLEDAVALAAKGAPREEIWASTGWFKGSDDKWRFEIPDNRMRVEGSGSGTWGKLIKHREYYRNYPEARRNIAHVEPGLASGMHHGDGTISVSGGNPTATSSVALHEMQHATQKKEGFARGGTPGSPELKRVAQDISQAGANRFAMLDNQMRDFQIRALEQLGIKQADRDYSRSMVEAAKEWGRLYPDKAKARMRALEDMETRGASSVYERLAGEVEARNVQKRQFLTPAQRRDKPPWQTQDTPDEQQILRFHVGGESAGARSEARKPFLRVLEDRIEHAVNELGLSRKEVLKRFIKGDMQ